MSSDDFRSMCPICQQKAEEKQAEARRQAAEAYGKVSADAYRRLYEQANKPVNLFETLHEYYEMGIELVDGQVTFVIEYSCNCSGCNFNYKFSRAVNDIKPGNERG